MEQMENQKLSADDLSIADLSGAYLALAKLSGADLNEALFSETVLGGTRLSGAIGLQNGSEFSWTSFQGALPVTGNVLCVAERCRDCDD
jgi:uncharacterized protein YjbI with pentapeptide repeats